MKIIAKMFVIYGVLVLLVVEAFNFIMKSSLFVLSMLVSFAGLLEGSIGSAAAVPQTVLRFLVYLIIPILIIVLLVAIMKGAGVAVPAAASAGGATGFVSKTGAFAGKLGMSGVRGAGVKKGALRSGIRALGNLSGDDLRKAGLASNVLGAKGIGKNLFRAGMAKDGFEAVRGAKAGQNKGKVAKPNTEGSELGKDGKPVKDAKTVGGKAAGGTKEAIDKAAAKADDAKDGKKARETIESGALAGVGAGAVGGRVSESSELTKEEERTENERVAEAVRESNNLDKTKTGEKVPGADEKDRDLNVNRTNTEIKNATLNGSSTALEPTSRTNSVDKNVDIGTNKDGIPVDAEVADANARKTSDALRGIAEAAPGQPVSEDGTDTAQMRSALVARNEEGQAVSTFADDEIRRTGEVLASSTAMHGTVVPREVTDSGDLSAENIEVQTADANSRYLAGASDTARVAAIDMSPEAVTQMIRDQQAGGLSSGQFEQVPEMVPAHGQVPEMVPVYGQDQAQSQAQAQQYFSDGSPIPMEPGYDPGIVTGGSQGGRFRDGTPIPDEPIGERSRVVSDPMVQTSPEVTEQVVRHEHHHFVDSASGLLGTGTMGMMDRGDALAVLMGGALGGLMRGAGGSAAQAAAQPEITISPDTMRAFDRAIETRNPRDRAIAKGAFNDEVGRAAPDAPPEVISEMEARFDEAIAAAERRALEEAEERERKRSASDGVNRGKRKRR